MADTAILFNKGVLGQYSKPFLIPQGFVGIISAWGFVKNKLIPEVGEPLNVAQMGIIQKMAFPEGIFPNGNTCDITKTLLIVDPPYSYAEDVTQCGVWNLSACQNLVGLSIPGTYRVFLNDEGAAGEIFMTLSRYYMSELPPLPHGIFLGD